MIQNKQFPSSESALQAFEQLLDIENSLNHVTEILYLFEVQIEVLDPTIATTLSQTGRPVAVFSRALEPSKQNHFPVEKEAYAKVESIGAWRRFLLGGHFKLIIDQRYVSFMYKNKRGSKIKNEKIMRWSVELSCIKYDIV